MSPWSAETYRSARLKVAMADHPAASRRLSWLVFITALIVFGYFYSGGGWNQNARFAMVRALVEHGELSIDSYLIYVRALPDPSARLRRIPIVNGEYERNGEHYLLMWPSKAGEISPTNDLTEGSFVATNFCPVSGSLEGRIAAVDRPGKTIEIEDSHKVRIPMVLSSTTSFQTGNTSISSEGLMEGQAVRIFCVFDSAARVEAKVVNVLPPEYQPTQIYKDLGAVAATGDVAFYGGHFYPNKAPGTSFTAIPVYWLIFHAEQLIGADPDDWWTLTINAWLTSFFSVAIVSAMCAVLFFKLASEFSYGCYGTSLIALGILALGTMFLPNGTLFYEHNIIAAGLIASFYFLFRAKMAQVPNSQEHALTRRVVVSIFLAGLFAGWAVIANYIFVVVVAFLASYLVRSVHHRLVTFWFALGLLGPFLLTCLYNVFCFDTPFTTNYHFQNPIFQSGVGHFLGVFSVPRWDVLLIILFSPFRGLFFTAPVLVMCLWGLFVWLRDPRLRAEGWLILAVFLFCVLWTASFNGWDGGTTAVARYLGPSVPFLALGAVPAISRCFKLTCGLGAISGAMMFCITAVDPQPPLGTGAAVVLDKPQWKYSPLFDYDLPVFVTQKPMPLLRQQEAQALHYYDLQLRHDGWTPSDRDQEINRIRAAIDERLAAGQPAPLLLRRGSTDSGEQYLVADSDLSMPVGPVSAHAFGSYGNWIDREFGGPLSVQARWNSFNIGEALFPQSRWSLLPFVVFVAFAVWRMIVLARARAPNDQK